MALLPSLWVLDMGRITGNIIIVMGGVLMALLHNLSS